MSAPNIKLDVGSSIPAGYILGRLTGGVGPAQLIPIASLSQQINVGSTPSGGGGGGSGVTSISAGTGITCTPNPITATGTVALSIPVTVADGGTGQTTYTDGQLLIGDSSSGGLDLATLTAGTAISITNGHGSITVAGAYTAGTGISITGASIANTGVTSVKGTNNIAPTAATTGAVTLSSNSINPTAVDADFVTWASIEGLRWKPTVTCATTAALPTVTYSNGSSGAGATLTASATGVVTIDGHALALADAVLVKNQASAFQNGIYQVTTAGAVGVALILTRAPWNDDVVGTTGYTAAIAPGDVISVLLGTVNANTVWIQDNLGSGTGGSIIVGTDNLAYTKIADPAFGNNNALWGPGLLNGSTIPTTSNIGTVTQRNFSAGTSVTNSTPGIDLVCTDSSVSSHNIRGIAWAVPSTPYKKKFLILVDISPTLASHWGIGWSDGTKTDSLYFGYDGPTVFHAQWTNDNTLASATSLYNNLVYCMTPVWVMLSDDGTTVQWTLSTTGRFLGSSGSLNFSSLRFLKSSGSLGSSGYTNFIVFVDTFTGPVGLSMQAYMNGP